MTDQLPSPDAPLKIGTRGSPLALAQAHETRDRLMAAFELPTAAFEIVKISTTGDQVQDRALKEIGNKGLFTKEIDEAMLDGRIDISVHSTKDMPVELPDGILLACFLPREDVRDAFLSEQCGAVTELPQGAVVGTSSLRRRAQLMRLRPDLQVVEFRGNVQTRLKKLRDGLADATFLAMAGLNRLGLDDLPAHAVPVDQMLPAVAQGAIGIERREGDARAERMLAAIHDVETGQRLAAERAFLAGLDGSCEVPIGGLAELDGEKLWLRGELLSPDGAHVVSGARRGAIADGAALGRDLADELRAGSAGW